MNNPVSPMLTSSALPSESRSPSQPRSPWSSLMSPTPSRARFPAMVLANLIRHKPANNSHSTNPLPSPCLLNPTTPYTTTPGEDLNNFVWDIGCSSDSPRSAHHEEELYEIARLYQPSIGKRTRPTPQPIITQRDLVPLSAGGIHEGALTPTLSSAGAFKSSIHKLLRKRTVLHLKNSSQSSSSTTSPSETSADAEDPINQELESTSDDEYRNSLRYSPFIDATHTSNPQPLTPPLHTYPSYVLPLSAPRTPARGRRAAAEEKQFLAHQLPTRSSSMGQ